MAAPAPKGYLHSLFHTMAMQAGIPTMEMLRGRDPLEVERISIPRFRALLKTFMATRGKEEQEFLTPEGIVASLVNDQHRKQKKSEARELCALPIKSYLEDFQVTSLRPLPSWKGFIEFWKGKTSIRAPEPRYTCALFQTVAMEAGMPTMEMFSYRDSPERALLPKDQFIALLTKFIGSRGEEDRKFLKPLQGAIALEVQVMFDSWVHELFHTKNSPEQIAILRAGWLPVRIGEGDFLIRFNAQRPDGSIDYAIIPNRQPAGPQEAKQLKFPFWQE